MKRIRFFRALLTALALLAGTLVAFTLTSPAASAYTTIPYTPGVPSAVVPGYPEPEPADYDGNGYANPAVVYDLGNGQLAWIINGYGAYVFCNSGDIPLPGNYFGLIEKSVGYVEANPPGGTQLADLTTNMACYRPSNQTLYILSADRTALYTVTFGNVGDYPVAGYFSNLNLTNFGNTNRLQILGLWRPSTGTLYAVDGHTLVTETYSGTAQIGSYPLAYQPDDFHVGCVGSVDQCTATPDHLIQRPINSNVYYTYCKPGQAASYAVCTSPYAFGNSSDIPFIYDYGWFTTGSNAGSHSEQIGVYRPSNHTFYVGQVGDGNGAGSLATASSFGPYGLTGDFPVPSNYNGSHASGLAQTNFAVYRPCNATFYIHGINGAADQAIVVGPAVGSC